MVDFLNKAGASALSGSLSLNNNILKIEGVDPSVHATYDFAYGGYLYAKSFYQEVSRIQNVLVSEQPLSLNGENLDLTKPGDLLGLQNYMSTLDGARNLMEGLSKKGLKSENDQLSKLGQAY
ncbi:hypothetical protein EBR96_03000 [bacterium]|nr:hypothetical protein [bacterium]